MKTTIVEDGREREVIKISCPVTEDNDQGFYIGYRDAMKEDEVEFGEGAPSDAVDVGRMNKTQLTEHLLSLGVEVSGHETKAELLELVPE